MANYGCCIVGLDDAFNASNPLFSQASSLRRAIESVVSRKTQLDRRLEQLALRRQREAWDEENTPNEEEDDYGGVMVDGNRSSCYQRNDVFDLKEVAEIPTGGGIVYSMPNLGKPNSQYIDNNVKYIQNSTKVGSRQNKYYRSYEHKSKSAKTNSKSHRNDENIQIPARVNDTNSAAGIQSLQSDESTIPGLGEMGLSSEINSLSGTIQQLVAENLELRDKLQQENTDQSLSFRPKIVAKEAEEFPSQRGVSPVTAPEPVDLSLSVGQTEMITDAEAALAASKIPNPESKIGAELLTKDVMERLSVTNANINLSSERCVGDFVDLNNDNRNKQERIGGTPTADLLSSVWDFCTYLIEENERLCTTTKPSVDENTIVSELVKKLKEQSSGNETKEISGRSGYLPDAELPESIAKRETPKSGLKIDDHTDQDIDDDTMTGKSDGKPPIRNEFEKKTSFTSSQFEIIFDSLKGIICDQKVLLDRSNKCTSNYSLTTRDTEELQKIVKDCILENKEIQPKEKSEKSDQPNYGFEYEDPLKTVYEQKDKVFPENNQSNSVANVEQFENNNLDQLGNPEYKKVCIKPRRPRNRNHKCYIRQRHKRDSCKTIIKKQEHPSTSSAKSWVCDESFDSERSSDLSSLSQGEHLYKNIEMSSSSPLEVCQLTQKSESDDTKQKRDDSSKVTQSSNASHQRLSSSQESKATAEEEESLDTSRNIVENEKISFFRNPKNKYDSSNDGQIIRLKHVLFKAIDKVDKKKKLNKVLETQLKESLKEIEELRHKNTVLAEKLVTERQNKKDQFGITDLEVVLCEVRNDISTIVNESNQIIDQQFNEVISSAPEDEQKQKAKLSPTKVDKQPKKNMILYPKDELIPYLKETIEKPSNNRKLTGIELENTVQLRHIDNGEEVCEQNISEVDKKQTSIKYPEKSSNIESADEKLRENEETLKGTTRKRSPPEQCPLAEERRALRGSLKRWKVRNK